MTGGSVSVCLWKPTRCSGRAALLEELHLWPFGVYQHKHTSMEKIWGCCESGENFNFSSLWPRKTFTTFLQNYENMQNIHKWYRMLFENFFFSFGKVLLSFLFLTRITTNNYYCRLVKTFTYESLSFITFIAFGRFESAVILPNIEE